MKETVGAFEAKTHFSALLERVAQGDEIYITRRGKTIAKMVPVQVENIAATRAAIARIKKLARELNLGKFEWEEWKGYRDQGKR